MKRFVSIISAIAMIFSMVSFDISIVQAEEYNGLIYSIENETVTITGANGLLTEIEIPSEIESYPVTAIASEAFYNSECRDVLESVTLPDSITSIGNAAFANCENLKTINIPEGITVLNEEVFRSCVNLKSLYLYETLTAFDYCAVGGCEFDYIFYEGSQSQFNKISLDKGCEQVADATIFYNCDHAHNFVDYVSNNNATCEADGTETVSCTECDVTHTRTATNSALGHSWTEWSTIVTATSESAGLEKRICTNDDSHVEYNVVYLKEYEGLTFDIENETAIVTGVIGMLTDIVIPDRFAGYTVTTIAEDAFYQSDCHTVMKTIVIPTNITNIGDMAFAKCDVLETIYYTGNESSFNKISIVGKTNASYVADATIVYNYGQHIHSWGAWSITTEPTQTETGVAQRVCDDDDSHVDTIEIDELSNTKVWAKGEYIASTCEANGSQEYISEYGIVVETIPSAHDWGAWITTKEATYTEAGLEERVCKTNNSHKETRELPILGNAEGFAGGSGTQTDPYQVATPEQLNKVRDYLSSHFIQICDIDMTTSTSEGGAYYNRGAGWTAIGDNNNAFTGSYNGQNHKIIGLTSINETTDYTGLFGYNKGVLKNITLECCNMFGGKYTGILVGHNGANNTYSHSVEGIKIIECTASGADYVGALAGKNIGGSISNIEIKDCSITGTDYVGGISGSHDRNGTSNGEIIDVKLIYSNVTGTKYVGGIVGKNYATVENCYVSGKITGGIYTGGIVGDSYQYVAIPGEIISCFVDGTVGGNQYVGGIAGNIWQTSIEKCANNANIRYIASDNEGVLGGIAAQGNSFSVTECANNGNIEYASNVRCAGGIIGYISAYESWLTLEDCYNTGSVFSSNDANIETGAIVGAACSPNRNVVFYIENCYSSDSTYNNKICSGNAKYNPNLSDYMTISYTNCYLINTNSDTSSGVTLLSSDEMKVKDNFVGFDFDTIWSIASEKNSGYPYLSNVATFENEHTHTWGVWSITKEPTQTETGTAERICGSNNQHIDSKEIASLSDETVWSKGEYITPTCTEAGAQKYVSEYGTVTEIIPAAHSWGAWRIATEPTKTTVGEAQRICDNDSNHVDTKELPVLTDTTVWTAGAYVAPACEVNGSQTYTSEYGTVVETIASIGHSWGEWTTTKEPTLTATGTAERICNNDSNHKETKEVATLENTTEFAGGRGTNTDPYKVSTPEHLNNVRNYLSAYFIQINEIDMTAATSEGGAYYNNGAGWKPIGTSDSSSTLFKGEYNGNGYAIKGLYCKGTLGGLFGYSSGTLKNIAMVDCDIIGTSTYTGSIVSYNKGTVQGCYTTGNVTTTSTSTSSRMGGLVGRSLTGSSIIDCYNIGTVSGGNGYVGGIVGYAEYTTINNCYNDATLTSTKATKMGGIVGYAYGSSSTKTTISNCYNLGKVSSSYTSAYLGGIAGDSYYTTIETCFNKAVLDSTSKYSGGISGYGNYVTISQCLNEAKITNATSYMGGIIGYFARGDINDCYNKGLVNKAAGAIAGYGASSSYAKITNCYNSSTAVANTLASGSYKVTTSYNIVTDSKATVLTSDEMKEKDSFVGFDFDTVWDISSDKNEGMPYLRNLPTQHSHTHTWGAWKFTLEPTTTTTGEVQRVCETNINHIEIVELPVLTDTTVWTAGAYVAPSCEVNGSQEYTCEYGTVIETIAATGHDWDDWVTIKEATYTEKGSEKRICKTDSSHVETREIATIVNAVGFAGGSGTQTDPYQVATPEQLNKVRDYLSSHFIQICDIDMTAPTSEGGAYYNNGKGWTPIGNSSKKFTGSYDGAEYSITGLFCNTEYAGLFGYNNGGVVKNINLTGTIIGTNAYAGGIVAYNYSKSVLTNCTFDGSVSSSSSYAGGITGNNYGTVTDCTNYANITSSSTYAGGVIGYNSSSSDITNCYNYGEVVSADFAGGIVGFSQSAQISNCGNEGNISSTTKTDTQVGYGGIAGRTNKNITQCYNKGNITATVTRSTSSSTSCAIGVGGIVGLAANGITVSDCFNTGKISSLYTCGDIVGSGSALKGWTTITTGESYQTVPESSVLTIKNCYNSYSNSTNNFYGYNASGYSFNYGYQANSGSYSNIVTVSASNSYNINADTDTNVTQLTESEMKQKDKYVGFDFDTIWAISSSQNNGTPYLRGVGNFEPTYSMGDVNGDGYIDFIDAQVILKYDAGLITLTDDQISRSDINNDGYVDFIDAQIILKFDAGLIDTLE